MNTSQDNIAELVTVIDILFDDDTLHVQLSDGRRVSLPLSSISWLEWLSSATHDQRAGWAIEPGGYAVYWDELDDGFEIAHLLGLQTLS